MRNNIRDLIEHIVKETIDIMQESHQRGEWWIDETGGTVFADGDIGDSNHEGVVIQNLSHEILSHFGIEKDETGELGEYEENIKESLVDDGRLSGDELEAWDDGPREIIIAKLLEDKVYSTPEQAKDAVYIAYGSNRDARDYAMRYWRWKIMKTSRGEIEIQTWNLKPDDLGIIVRGIWEIMEDDNDADDSDKEVGDDNYSGPRVNVTVQASGRRFSNIPLAVLEKKMPQTLHNYQSGVHSGYTENIMEDYHHITKGYRLYEGHNHIIAIFDDNTRLMFEVHYHENRGEDKIKHRAKAASKWKTLATKLHNDIQLNKVGNKITKSWKECFQSALNAPEMKEFIRQPHHKRIFDF